MSLGILSELGLRRRAADSESPSTAAAAAVVMPIVDWLVEFVWLQVILLRLFWDFCRSFYRERGKCAICGGMGGFLLF